VRRARWLGILFATLLLTGACVSSSRSDQDYERKAANTAESALSAVQTARITAEAALRGRTTGPYTSVLLGDAEQTLGEIHDTFTSVQPPSTDADQLRDQLDTLLSDADDALSQLRIAARRQDQAGLAKAVQPLAKIADQLDKFEQEHQ
jgi:hypothetical protein